MGDTNHLERMGKELKCPICLSLFNSAVSLSCNHVFCNECIVKSMKIDATCSVCKIPYHHRDIRSAPHMDSLVSIYKSMEVASSVNILISQNKQSPSDKEKHVRDDIVKKRIDRNCQGYGKGRKSKGKELRNIVEMDLDADKEKHVKDDLVKKRDDKNRQGSGKGRKLKGKELSNKKEIDLDVPGSIVLKPSSQTKKRVQLLQNLSSESLTKSTESVEIAEKQKIYTENTVISLGEDPGLSKEVNLSPFFWLRDEYDDEERLSQLAESDQLLDNTPVDIPSFSDLKDSDHESPSKGDEQEKPNAGDMFDSEMFEWTQRPCSPEILPSPVKAKIQVGSKIDLTQKKLSKEASSKCKKRKARSAKHTEETQKEPSAGENIDERQEQDSHGTSGKDMNLDEIVKAKRTIRRKSQSSQVQSGLKIVQEEDGKKGTKRKRSSIESSPVHLIAGSNELSLETETDRAHDSSNAQPEKHSSTKNSSLRKSGRKSNAKSCLKDLSGRTQKKTSEKKPKLDSCLISSKSKQSHGNDILTDELNQVTVEKNSPKKKKSTVDEDNHTIQVLKRCSKIKKSSLEGSSLLQRCDEPPTKKFTCAFCQSSEETEASGEIFHYHKGEPVSADFNGGSKITHAHENCVEWAPNIYYNDLTAINLDLEITRSKRISCSCCGLKGAALGCYNKNCKKSFHVTCAKLIPECRWDLENFVMLCPLDASFKLPCEETSPKESKSKLTPKGPKHSQSKIGELQSKNFSGIPKKSILCCSGLTDEEKTVVTEFTELSGVTLLRKWDSSVTHVIASINENGACKRTLKFMMGILEGKWILSIDWVKACLKNTDYVSEEPYEISMDVHGIQQGPYIGRQRAFNKKPKLFEGLKFYIMRDFEIAYKGYLQDLIVAAGGTIMHRRPICNDNEDSTIIVFSVEPSKNKTLTQRRSDAEALAKSAKARAASSSWVLDSIAGCQILDLI